MVMSPIDPNEVRLTGENSFIRLSHEDGGPLTARVSHWRVLYSPAGPGHVLFLQGDITENEVEIYSDNIALARWLQEEIETGIYPGFADQSVPVIEAEFTREGDVRSFSTEKVVSDDVDISLTWYDLLEPFVIRSAPGDGRTHGVYSVFLPARKAQLVVNGQVAQGQPFPQERGDRTSSTCALAWSETWVRPK